MTNLQNYRLKLDLCKFYNDHRRLSYIYVDTSKIVNVSKLHQKICQLFNINRSFYLITQDNVFLPLNEDIRIIDTQDIIIAQPEHCESNGDNQEFIPESTDCKVVNANFYDIAKPETKFIPASTSNSLSPDQKNQSHTSSNDTDIEASNTSVKPDKNASDVQINGSDNPYFSNIPQRKRRRVRRRRPKKDVTNASPVINGNSTNTTQTNRRPIKIHTRVTNTNSSLPAPKHLKFNWEDEMPIKDEQINGNSCRQSCESKPIIRSDESADLSALLSLNTNKFPLKFVSKRVRCNSIVHSQASSPAKSDSSIKIDTPTQVNSPINKCVNSIEEIDYSKVNPLDYPVHSLGFEVDDVIAFRTLRIGEDYSPTVSGYIIAKTTAKDSVGNTYTFKIIEGHDQVKIPDGKFTLPNDEENECEDGKLNKNEVTLHVSNLVEPRLIHRPPIH